MMNDRNKPHDLRQKPKPCRSCGKEIVFLSTNSGKKIPVNWESLHDDEKKFVTEAGPVEFDRTRHKTHFADCPAAKEFRKVKK